MSSLTSAWLIVLGLLAAQACISMTLAAVDAIAIAALHLIDRSWGAP